MRFVKCVSCVALFFGLLLSGTACNNKSSEKNQPPRDQPQAKTGKKDEGKVEISKVDDHSGWWCGEHGIPEADCSLCLPADEVKKRFKDTGDWCKLHDRAQSQCFLCEPTLYERVWEPKYVAKYGKKPERPPESEFKK